MTSLHASLGFIRYSIFKLPTEPAEVQVILCVLPLPKPGRCQNSQRKSGRRIDDEFPGNRGRTLTAVSPRRILQWIEGVFGMSRRMSDIQRRSVDNGPCRRIGICINRIFNLYFPRRIHGVPFDSIGSARDFMGSGYRAVIVMDGAITKAPVVSAGLFTGQVVPVNVLYTLT